MAGAPPHLAGASPDLAARWYLTLQGFRLKLLQDPALSGAGFCRAYREAADDWLRGLYETAAGDRPGLALVAVGGYGRGELSPHSDLDVLLLHQNGDDVAEIAESLWYPVWDEGVKLGHAVRTPREALALAASDLDTATALLEVRHLAGDAEVTADLAERAVAQWRKRSKRWLGELSANVRERHRRVGEVAFLLEPDLKDGRGGLRDVHALHWAERARPVLLNGDAATLATAYDTLLEVRVALHRLVDRPGDTLRLQEQDSVAELLGHGDADDLMRSVATAARSIAWASDEAWGRIDSSLAGPRGRAGGRDR
ncbi:MAG TPA: nucleotidyltransferase domain-containing protein, partial [Acidimicrobiales bacterium]|nr:nucleotidyltransferase domain-containing protein [Acidimicrobiales bacterium]